MSRWIGGDVAAPACDLVMQGTNVFGKQVARQTGGTDFQSVSMAFGDEHSQRTLAVVLCIRGEYSLDIPDSGVLASLTIGGTAMTVGASVFEHNDSYVQTVIGYIKKPAGTSGVVAWHANLALNSNSDSFCGIYNIKHLRQTPIVHSAEARNAEPAAVALNVPNRAAIIAGFVSKTSGTPLPTPFVQTWSGLTPDSQDSFIPGASAASGSMTDTNLWFAHAAKVAADAAYDLSCTGSGNLNCLAAMAIR